MIHIVSCSALLLGNEDNGSSLCSGLNVSGSGSFLLRNSFTESSP